MKINLLKDKKGIVLAAIVVLQLIALFIYNLTKLRYQADFDSSSGMLQLVEIWRQKTLLLKDWEYQTTVGWDIPLPFAVPFYALTKNAFLSMGIANILFVLLYLYVFYDILKRSSVGISCILPVIIILLTPYTIGQLGYYPMLFIGTASYSMKVLITLLALDILVRLEQGIMLRKSIGHIVLFLAFSMISGLSSGIYMLICGIAPIVLYLALRTLIFNDIKQIVSKSGLVAVCGGVVFLAGCVLAKGMGLSNNSSSMQLLTANKLVNNALSCFAGIWELFGAVKDKGAPQVISKEGIACLLSVLITVFLIFVIIYYAVKLLQGKEKRAGVAIVICVIFVNMCVLCLTDTTYASKTFEYRYHIVAMIPALLLFGFFFQDMSEKLNVMSRAVLLIAAVGACVVISGGKFAKLYEETKAAKIDELSRITDVAKEQGIDLIYLTALDSSKNVGDGRLLRLCDFDISVVTLFSSYSNGYGWGGSGRYFENGRHPGRIMIVTDDNDLKEMPEFLTARMTKIDEMMDYHIYVAEENIFDCSLKMPEEIGDTAVDFPYSFAYDTVGTINADGELVAPDDGGRVMYATTVVPVDGVFDISLNYHLKDDYHPDDGSVKNDGDVLGTFYVFSEDGKKSESVPIIAGQECIIKGIQIDEDMGTFHYSVEALSGSGIKIKSIEAERTQ